MKTSSLLISIDDSNSVSNCPALPTNGLPCSSSVAPGASPMNKISAFGLPSPGTGFFACLYNGQSLQFAISSEILVKESILFYKCKLKFINFRWRSGKEEFLLLHKRKENNVSNTRRVC